MNEEKAFKFTRKHLDIAIAVIFLLLLVMFFMMYKNSGSCLADPFKYGIEKLNTEDNKVKCMCSFSKPNYAPFSFDEEGISVGLEGFK